MAEVLASVKVLAELAEEVVLLLVKISSIEVEAEDELHGEED